MKIAPRRPLPEGEVGPGRRRRRAARRRGRRGRRDAARAASAGGRPAGRAREGEGRARGARGRGGGRRAGLTGLKGGCSGQGRAEERQGARPRPPDWPERLRPALRLARADRPCVYKSPPQVAAKDDAGRGGAGRGGASNVFLVVASC